MDTVQRANRASTVDVDGFPGFAGSNGGWARTEYGEYYATSVPVYAAIRLRSDALSRAPAVVYRTTESGSRVPVERGHPAQRILEHANRWYNGSDLWRATEIYLNLWGSAFWSIERNEKGQPELWPLRPDRVSIVPDRGQHIRGFVYNGRDGRVAYTPDEMVWFRYFNPLEDYAGLSPIAPLRMSADMGKDSLRFNRNFLRNSAQPDFVLLTNETMTDNEMEEFYRRWEARFRGPSQAHRPAVASFVRDIKTLGISHREMDFIQGLRWSLEEVSRTYGVPKPLLSDLERATFSNVNAAERFFWRNTMVPEMRFIADQVTRNLFPALGYPGLELEFDLSAIEGLSEDESVRVSREAQLLDRGVLTINEVRRSRNLADVPWGDGWAKAPKSI
ncbi:MAG: phage portal protein [Chloroflexi bacterium]|nr:phage portal protein [Chloroflexota bacterium]MDA1270137.1 phage portal protein [Chloroflexota bacterium]